MKFQQIEAIIDREIMPCILQIQGIEAGLGFFQSYFHFAGLQYLVGMIGREAECHTTVYDIFSQTEGEVHSTFFGFFITDRIIVQRACHTGHGRIITVTILIADYLLQDNGHLFLIDHIRSGLHICLTVTKID